MNEIVKIHGHFVWSFIIFFQICTWTFHSKLLLVYKIFILIIEHRMNHFLGDHRSIYLIIFYSQVPKTILNGLLFIWVYLLFKHQTFFYPDPKSLVRENYLNISPLTAPLRCGSYGGAFHWYWLQVIILTEMFINYTFIILIYSYES